MNYSDFFPEALTLAHRFFAAADILALAAALIFRLFAGALAAGLAPLTFAQRALAAAEILARPAALIPFLNALAAIETESPRIEAISLVNASTLSLRSAARRSCVVVNDNRLLIVGGV